MKRPETGAMVFGEDWPGVFIRGDSAFSYKYALQVACDELSDDHFIIKAQLKDLINLLSSCNISTENASIQKIKSFNEVFLSQSMPFKPYPKHWPKRNNGGTICDSIKGPCSCGAWHTEDESWIINNIKLFGEECNQNEKNISIDES